MEAHVPFIQPPEELTQSDVPVQRPPTGTLQTPESLTKPVLQGGGPPIPPCPVPGRHLPLTQPEDVLTQSELTEQVPLTGTRHVFVEGSATRLT